MRSMLRIRALLILFLVVDLSGCASRRSFELANDSLNLDDAQQFYIVVPEMTERVVYSLFPPPTSYEKYASGRKLVEARPDVPREIGAYLERIGKSVTLGPEGDGPEQVDVLISYVELWGWDLRPIIKSLTIEFHNGDMSEHAEIIFSEMKFFNTQPTAKSLVSQMLDKVFDVADAP